MNSRGLSQAARCSECAVRVAGRGISIQQRTFSTSDIRRKHGAVPKLTEASSPELQTLFTRLRENLFLPLHVTNRQRDLIFKPKYQKSLETEPAIANIAGEEFTLKHLNVVTDVPGKSKSLIQALNLMTDRKDWDSLPSLLRGLRTAKFQYTTYMLRKLVSKAGAIGRQDVILECLRQVDKTGLTLTDPEFVVQIFYWMQHKALVSGWKAEETRQALLWAENVRELMDEPKHKAHQENASTTSAKDQPEVSGILLQLAAVRAAKQQDGKDVDGKVDKYAQEFLASPQNIEEVSEERATFWLSTHAPVLHGLKAAQTILEPGTEVSRGLEAKYEELKRMVLSAKNQLSEMQATREKPLHGLWVYEKLLGPEAS